MFLMSDNPYILIAEDEKIFQMIFEEQLSEYNIKVVENGKLCIEAIKEREPDLLLLDINMPVMSGFDVLLELNEHQQYKQLPIVFLTATPVENIKELPLDLTVNDYLIKPYDEEELLAMVNKYMN